MTLLEGIERPGSRAPLAVSCAIHAVVFWFVVDAPGLRMPKPAESEYKLAIAGKEEKLLWYKFKKLPAVTQPRRSVKSVPKRETRAESKAAQEMVAARNDAPKRQQTVLSPAPELAAAPIEAPNVIAVKLPPKEFVTPPDLVRPAPALPEVPPVPELPQVAAASEAPRLQDRKLPPRPYVPPAVAAPVLSEPKLAGEAPGLAVQPANAAALVSSRLPPRPYVPPAAGTRPPAAALRPLPDAPQLQGARTAVRGGLPGAVLPAPPAPLIAAGPVPDGGTGASLDLAIIGLKPVDRAPPAQPASAPAAFSGGPVVRPRGADADGPGQGIALPGLFVKGPVAPRPDLLSQAYAAPTAPETLRAALRGLPGGVRIEPSAEAPAGKLPGGAARVSGGPDPRFNGRDVFMMAIQMPNLTSYSGSWLMWYSDRSARQAGLAPIAPPQAHRKVDPKYVPTAVEERVEGAVRLYCTIGKDGNVSAIEVVQGADPRLTASAVEALSKWEFYPATRNGEPLDVDVLVEIPFRLAPRTPSKK